MAFEIRDSVFNLWKLVMEPHIMDCPRKLRHIDVPQREFRIHRDGVLAAIYVLDVPEVLYANHWRPYVYPFCTPSGIPLTCNAPPDHTHHRSVWIGHGEVNKTEFFIEAWDAGIIRSFEAEACEQGARAVVRQKNRWITHHGDALLEENRVLTMTGDEFANILDIDCTLKALGRQVDLDPTIHGFFAVRTIDHLEIWNGGNMMDDRGNVGHIRDRVDTKWLDSYGVIGGRKVGIALYSHPKNPRQPMCAAPFGWMTVNPFWMKGISLEPGRSIDLSCRVVGHEGWHEDIDLNRYVPK